MTRETEGFDILNYALAPRLCRTIKSDCDRVQETVLRAGHHLRWNIPIAKVDGIASEKSCGAYGHSKSPSSDFPQVTAPRSVPLRSQARSLTVSSSKNLSRLFPLR